MRYLLQLVLLLFLAFISGAVIAYPVYAILNLFFDIPFHKVISHVTSFCGLIIIMYYLRFQNSLNSETTGFQTSNNYLQKHMFQGFLFGIFIMFFLEILLYSTGVHIPEPELVLGFGFFVILILKATVSSLIVALLEETIYRGALLGALIKTNGVIIAITTSSIIFAGVHFISYPRINDPEVINLITGIRLLPHIFDNLANPEIIDAFLALTAFGVLLSMVRIMTGNIFICISIHAGVVFAIKFIKEFTDYNHANSYPFLVSSYDHLLGFLAFAWLLILIIFIWHIYRKSQSKAC